MRRAIPIILCLLLSVGCASREEVVSVRGGLYGLSGSQSQREGISIARSSGGFAQLLGEEEDAEGYDALSEAGYLRLEDAKGNITLISRSPTHLIHHLRETLVAEETELLLEQVLSERTKQNYRARGRDPMEAVEFLARNRSHVLEFLAQLPMGERTPDVLQEPIGRNMFRYRVGSAVMLGLKFDTLDVIIEERSFRLLLIH